ncbi:MAG TPA: DUF1697 domain-containing protein, partial [Caulobacteraceae bacterium]|nr:DUF1697 domain-containing protein [Caulobacteraceae bacterium]
MALTCFVALIRAINVGGRNAIAMADLRAWLGDLGYLDARSLLQSGNLVFRGDGEAAALEARLAAEATARFGLTTDFLVRTADEWRAVIANNPFASEAEHDPAHLIVMVLKRAPERAVAAALQAAIPGRERVHAHGRELYIVYPDGIGASKLAVQLVERKL